MNVKVSWPVPGEPPGAVFFPVMEDACHFFVLSQVTSRVYRIPHRNVYIHTLSGEPQEHKQAISDYIKEHWWLR